MASCYNLFPVAGHMLDFPSADAIWKQADEGEVGPRIKPFVIEVYH